MRRTLTVLVVLAVIGLGASVASALTRTTIAIRAVVAEAGWQTFDEATGAGEFGVIQFAREKTRTTAVIAVSRGELLLCAGGDTPTEADDFYGFRGTSIQGEGPARLSVGRSYSSATGSAEIRAQVVTVDECSGGSETSGTESISVGLDMTSIGPVVTQKGRTTLAIPKQLRSKTFIQSRARDAAGTVVLDGRKIDVGGAVGELSLRGVVITR